MTILSPAVVVTGVGAALMLAYAAHRHRQVLRVPAELRCAQLYWPRPILGPLTLRLARSRGRDSTPLPGIAVTRSSADTVDFYAYERSDRERPSGVLLWLHGGGRIAGRAALDHRQCSYLAAETGYLVISADYRLAPEHPFPAALDDVLTALRWIHQNATQLGVDRCQVVIGGASAGGGLAAEACQRATDEGIPVARQVLAYPMLDEETAVVDAFGRGRLGWAPASNRYAWRSYLHPGPGREAPPYAVASRREHLGGLPPAWIGVGDLDLFFREDVDYARRLTAAGVHCELDVVPGMYHGADLAVDPQPASMAAFWHRMACAVTQGPGRAGP